MGLLDVDGVGPQLVNGGEVGREHVWVLVILCRYVLLDGGRELERYGPPERNLDLARQFDPACRKKASYTSRIYDLRLISVYDGWRKKAHTYEAISTVPGVGSGKEELEEATRAGQRCAVVACCMTAGSRATARRHRSLPCPFSGLA